LSKMEEFLMKLSLTDVTIIAGKTVIFLYVIFSLIGENASCNNSVAVMVVERNSLQALLRL
jgi:hypothetical protein